MIDTSGFLTALEFTEFVFGRGSARTSLVELTALPRPPSWFILGLLRGETGRKGKGKEREERPAHLRKFLDPPLILSAGDINEAVSACGQGQDQRSNFWPRGRGHCEDLTSLLSTLK